MPYVLLSLLTAVSSYISITYSRFHSLLPQFMFKFCRLRMKCLYKKSSSIHLPQGCHLGDTVGLEMEPEFLGEGKGMGEVVGDSFLRLHRSPLCNFHRSSSFSIDRRLLTLDSFSRDSCKTACSVESCLGRGKGYEGEEEKKKPHNYCLGLE